MWYYLKSTTRKIKRNLLNSTVKLLGITVGLLTILFITIYVVHESSYDEHIADSQNVYRLVRNWQNSGDYSPSTPASLLNEMMSTFPEIETGTRLHFLHDKVVSYQEKVVQENAIYGVDSLFIKTFNLSLLEGDTKSALNSPGQVILSQSACKMFFGSENPLGKSLGFEGEEFNDKNKTFTVTGVYPDYPANTHFRPNFLLSLKSFEVYSRKESSNHSLMTYVRLKEGTNKQLFETKLPAFLKLFYGAEYYDFAKSTYLLQPITNIHLDTWVYPYGYETESGDSRTLYMFPLLGLLILIIAGINYFHLTIAEGHQNINTFGINKIMGADRFYYFKIFFLESGINICSALILAILLGNVLLPDFGKMMGRQLDFHFFTEPQVLVFCGFILVCFILLAAVFPAMIFSGKNVHHSISMRKGLPSKDNLTHQISQVLQFTICIFFIIASIISYKQIHFVYQETNSTMKTENVLVIQNARYLENQRNTFKQELIKLPCVKSVSMCSAVPGFPDISNWGFPIDKALENVHVSVFECDPEYLNTLNIEIVKGRFFNPEIQSDKQAIVLNETAIKKLGWEDDPIGKRYRVGQNYTVIGVARDVHFEALQYLIFPQAYVPNRHENSASKVIVKLETKNTAESIKQINSLWNRFIPHREMYYKFMDEEFAKWYKTEQKTATLAVILSFIAIFLSNLSLFASILFKIQRRIKEIGIRKVNGAKVSEVLGMLNKDFVKWVIVAFVFATPIAWYAMHKWLENFAYKTELSWWIFLLAGLLALGIALLTVSWKSWKAATRNPVEALRYE